MDLVTFLAARLDEDEAAAKAADAVEWQQWQKDDFSDFPEPWIDYSNRFDPARVLREVGAGRKILALHLPDEHDTSRCQRCDETRAPCSTLRALATVYGDHPDYREEWRR